MHQEALAWVAGHTKGRRYARVLEFGSLDINGSPREVLDAVNYWGIDPQPGPGVDEIASAVGYLYDVRGVDLVVCCEVLEHAPEVEAIVLAAFENLRPGGVFIVTCAGPGRAPHSAVDGGPLRDGEHYENVPYARLYNACQAVGFIVQDSETNTGRGDLYMRAKRP